jgi:hypothetical protein
MLVVFATRQKQKYHQLISNLSLEARFDLARRALVAVKSLRAPLLYAFHVLLKATDE